eukprot:scaffold71956_cov38-Attheya_sp.AAC.1
MSTVVVCKSQESQVPRVSRLPSSSQVASPSRVPSLLWHTMCACVVWVGVFQCGQCGHVRCT